MILDKLFGRAASLATKYSGYALPEIPGELFGGRQSAAGVTVTEEDALSLSAVFAAVNLLSRSIGSLPLVVFRQQGRAREPALTHPAYRLLKSESNPEMTASTFRRTLEIHRLLWGNAYAEIGWVANGNVAALWPVEPWRVRLRRDDHQTLYYWVDSVRRVEAADMIHVQLISFDGRVGKSFLDYALESLGLGLGTQEFAARYFGSGAKPGGILKHPGNPNEKARKEFRDSWTREHGGPSRSNRIAVLWGGWEYADDGAKDAQQSQLVEQRRFSTEEVARWFNVPPHLLRDLTHATYSNIEFQGIDYVVYSLQPVLVDYEQEYDRKLLSPPDLYCKHNVTALLRGDSQARAEYYTKLFSVGGMSVNDIRELEELNPVPGGGTHFVPLNMVPLEVANQGAAPKPTPEPPRQPEPEQPRSRPGRSAMAGLLEVTLTRLGKVEMTAVRRLAGKPGHLDGWLEEFYPRHQGILAEALGPVLAMLGELVGEVTPSASQVAGDWCTRSRTDLEDLAGRTTPARWGDDLGALVAAWEQRPGQLAATLIEGAYHGD